MILYFHGGGFVAGTPETHRGLAGRLAQAGEADLFSRGISPGAGMFLPRAGA